VQIRHYICGHLADFLRVNTVSRSEVTCNDVIGHLVGPVKGHKGRREQKGHKDSLLSVENNDVIKMKGVEQKEGNGITSDVPNDPRLAGDKGSDINSVIICSSSRAEHQSSRTSVGIN